jgi:hypothetical protein
MSKWLRLLLFVGAAVVDAVLTLRNRETFRRWDEEDALPTVDQLWRGRARINAYFEGGGR